MKRRHFLLSLAASLAVTSAKPFASAVTTDELNALDRRLLDIANQPILDLSRFDSPLVVRSVELLKHGSNHLVRVRTNDGAEGLSVPNVAKIKDFYPVFVNRIAPFFIGKDLRKLESLQDKLYRDRGNYKMQGIGLWVPYAAAEMAILDL
ncbi:MAG: mandelate racemase/muconate lactonizing enzyme family protein, partial [Planctomycetota bacterium]